MLQEVFYKIKFLEQMTKIKNFDNKSCKAQKLFEQKLFEYK